jgi:hypothetical protein
MLVGACRADSSWQVAPSPLQLVDDQLKGVDLGIEVVDGLPKLLVRQTGLRVWRPAPPGAMAVGHVDVLSCLAREQGDSWSALKF